MARATRRSANRSAWEDQSVEANKEAPALKKALRSEKWKRRALYTVAFAAVPLAFLFSAALIANSTDPDVPVDYIGASTISNGSPGKAEAYRALQAWIDAAPSPLPGGEIVSWNGYALEQSPMSDQTGEMQPEYDYSLETHTFTVGRAGQMWTAQVQVAVSDVIGAKATSTPSLEPVVVTDGPSSNGWFGVFTTAAGPAVVQAVETWAEAFTSGDPDELHQTVQDRDTNRTYIPLFGVAELLATDLAQAANLPDPSSEDGSADPDMMIVRVNLQFWWNGAVPETQPNKRQEMPAPVSYDVLVEHASTATPVVVAWGAPGSGPTLVPYQNAIPGTVSAENEKAATTAPTPTPTPTSTEGDSK